MKKIYLGLLAISTVGMLAACGGSSNGGYVIKEGDSVLSEQLMQANYNENEQRKDALKFSTYKVEDFDMGDVVSGDDGYVVIKKDGKYGVYSLLMKKYLIEPRLTVAPNISSDPVFGLTVKFQEPSNEHWVLADGVGNVIYESEEAFTFTRGSYKTNYNRLTKKNDLYIQYVINDPALEPEKLPYVPLYFKYDINNAASKVSYEEFTAFDKGTHGGDIKDSFVYDLKDLGLEGSLRLVRGNGYWSFEVYGTDGAVKGSGEFLENYNPMFYGKNLLAQRVNGADGLIQVDTKVYNLETFKEETLDIPARIDDITELEGVENAEHQYFAVELEEVKDGRYNAKRTMIMDEEFKFHDDISKKNFVEWIRLGNGNFYDYRSKTLYDKDFKYIAYLGGYTFIAEYETFRKDVQYAIGDAYVMLNSNGKYMFDTKYLVSEEPIIGDVYSIFNTDVGPFEAYYGNAKDGSVWAFNHDTGKGVTKIEETERANYFVKQVVKTYNNEDRDEELTAKRAGSIKTFDGQVIVEVAEKLTDLDIYQMFDQSVLVEKPAKFFTVETTADAVSTYYVAYTQLLTGSGVPAPSTAA